MVLSCPNRGHDDLLAVVWLPLLLLSLQPIVVPETIGANAIIIQSHKYLIPYTYSFSNLSTSKSALLVNSSLKNLIASSNVNPMPFRKSPYCSLALYLMWCSVLITPCMLFMQRGKFVLLNWFTSCDLTRTASLSSPYSSPVYLSRNHLYSRSVREG